MTTRTDLEAVISDPLEMVRLLSQKIDVLQAAGGGGGEAEAVDAIGLTTELTAPTSETWLPPGIFGEYIVPSSPTGDEIDAVANNIMTQMDGQVNNKVDQAALTTFAAAVESRLGVVESKIDELIAALKAGGVMASE